MRFHQELIDLARKRIEHLGLSSRFNDDQLYEIAYLLANDAVVCMDMGTDKYTDPDWRGRNLCSDLIRHRKSQHNFVPKIFQEKAMITIEQSYAMGMSPKEFYESEKQHLFELIRENGQFYHVMSRSWDSGVSCYGIELLGGFLLTDDGDIASPDRWFSSEPEPEPEPEPKRKPIKPSLRFEILKRDGYRCQMCGVTAKDGATLEIDHVTPVSKGGSNDADNLQVLCRDCNIGKSDNFQ